mmetsp:Transcript_32166/g.91260  ORF Transcript_32166/g.91260 Transcript_32166/m.91260 type:complete len:318 (+) Transcript_32166:346-1299(+)|eukprot:CAMPEP_0117675236 /NCGR_PEP_ID=MMETSP0804-20121206/15492_1 /TAXON_ID=1074897 /ORGANISM="Tetraselmis astigmatica, Strain CCMP880" /LENGTH=317 /DNA_ID=CAMNT_0005484215 /DNA_START=279 /DNA_END=1232 /DNA_ORIENTATION=-
MSSTEGALPNGVRLGRASAPVQMQTGGQRATLSRKNSAAKPFRLDPNAATALEAEINKALKRMDQQHKDAGKQTEGEPMPSASHSWRIDLVYFLHQHWVHTLATALLVMDLIIVVVSLELQIQIGRLEGEAMMECLYEFEEAKAVPRPFLNSTCNPLGLHTCEPHESPAYRQAETLHHVEMILAIISCVILSTFLLENILMLVALGFNYFRHIFFVLDFVVVSISLGLELWAIITTQLNDVEAYLGILIIGRMWRFFRVAHGLYFLEHSEEAAQEAHIVGESNHSDGLLENENALSEGPRKLQKIVSEQGLDGGNSV